MQRRQLLQSAIALAALPVLQGIVRAADRTAVQPITSVIPPLRKPLDAWRKLVSPASFNVMFQDGTERPFTSPLLAEHRPGTFVCAACMLPLFSSAAKFESGTGWPSFTQSLPGRTAFKDDYKLLGMQRTEYHCVRCGGHQGHRFDDGPQPRGERWCNNGVALNFIPKGQPLPAWRT